MSCGRLLPTLVALVLVGTPVVVGADSGSGSVEVVQVDAGVPVASTAPNPAPAGSGSAIAKPADIPDEQTTVQDIASAIHSKDWFLLAGAALAGLIHLARYILKSKWPRWGESHYGVYLAAGMAAIASLAIAWTSGGDVVSSHTLLGALKLMVAAIGTYVIPQKITQGLAATGTASSSDVPKT